MAYRNGTYVAFNGMDTTDPSKSDMKYYGLLQAWNTSKKHDFTFSDSHKKTYSVLDSSQITTLKNRLLERLRNSKHLLLIATELASINRGLLNWEIEKAVETYGLPIIVVYPGYEFISDSINSRLPEKLVEYIREDKVKSIHIPFKQALIDMATDETTISNLPPYTVTVYTDEVYKKLGLK